MMKKIIYNAFIGLLIWCCAIPLTAQTSHSAYFLEGMPNRHKLNPALESEYNYVSFPLLGDVNLGSSGNIGVGSFFFPAKDGSLNNFLNSQVDSQEFLGNLKSQNKIITNLDISVLSAGFYKWKGFNTIDISLHTNAGIQMPKEIFEFLKVGRKSVNGPTRYEIRDINLNSSAYMDIALGHSHKINDKWTVGAKIKGLIGIGSANLSIDKMDITMDANTNQWIIESKGSGDIALKGLEFETKNKITSKGKKQEIIDGVNADNMQFGINGGGLAFDFGATYRPIKNLEISASVVDLGFITWKNNKSFETISGGIVYDGFNTDDEDVDKIGEEFEEMTDFKEVYKPKKTAMLKASLNIGAEYSFLNNIISLGILSHTRFGHETYTEGMLVANFRAKKIFMMSINGTISNMGGSFGTLLNLCPKGFNLFLAIDCFPGLKVTPDYMLPINKFHFNTSLGISFNFGDRHSHDKI